jgi:hypothetical protein
MAVRLTFRRRLKRYFSLRAIFLRFQTISARVLLHGGAGVSDTETWTGQIVAISIQRIGQPRFHNSPGWTCENRPEVSTAQKLRVSFVQLRKKPGV